jgi:hypothetical protein
MTTAAENNLKHASETCIDPDCEIHHPGTIDFEAERLTAKAWFLAGALAYQRITESEDDADIALDIFKARFISDPVHHS